MIKEKIIFQEDNIKVTNSKVEIADKIYLINKIDNVSTFEEEPNIVEAIGLSLICAFVSAIACGLIIYLSDEFIVRLIIGIILVAVLYAAYFIYDKRPTKTIYYLQVSSGGTPFNFYIKSSELSKNVENAINEALLGNQK